MIHEEDPRGRGEEREPPSFPSGLPLVKRSLESLTRREQLALTVACCDGPQALADNGVKLRLDEAERVCDALSDFGLDVQPFDFPGTIGIWDAETPARVPYSRIATRQCLETLREKISADIGRELDLSHPSDFRELLQRVSYKTFARTPINSWGTKLQGLSDRPGSTVSHHIIDLVEHDPEFEPIHAIGLEPSDFPNAPRRTWCTKTGGPTNHARELVKRVLEAVADDIPHVDLYSPEGFKSVLDRLSPHDFQKRELNFWGSTAMTAMANGYGNRKAEALFDVITSYPEFSLILSKGVELYDLAPVDYIWASRSGEPTDVARDATARVILSLAQELGVSPFTEEGFNGILPYLTKEQFETRPISYWGTTAVSMLQTAYENSPSHAVIDCIMNDDRFADVQRSGLTWFDFPHTKSAWISAENKPTADTLSAVDILLKTFLSDTKLSPRSAEGLAYCREHLDLQTAQTLVVSSRGATLEHMLSQAFSNDIGSAIDRLVSSHPAYRHLSTSS